MTQDIPTGAAAEPTGERERFEAWFGHGAQAPDFQVEMTAELRRQFRWQGWLAKTHDAAHATAPPCAGDPGECAYNGACMYRCGRADPPSAPQAAATAACVPTAWQRFAQRFREFVQRNKDDWAAADVEAAALLDGFFAAAPQATAGVAPPKLLDDPRLQELFSHAIDGALTSGYQGVAPAPAGHWLDYWWRRGRGVAEAEAYEARMRAGGAGVAPTLTDEQQRTLWQILRGAVEMGWISDADAEELRVLASTRAEPAGLDEREAFRKWLAGSMYREERAAGMAWDAWQARASLAAPPSQQPQEKP